MKRVTNNIPLQTLIQLKLIVLFMLMGFSASSFAQTSAQSGNEQLVLQSEKGATKKIRKGALIHLQGPENTLPVKGRLKSVGSEVTVVSSNGKKSVSVPVEEIRSVKRVNIGLLILGSYFGMQVLYSLVGAFFMLFALGGLVGTAAILIVAIGLIGIVLYGLIVWACFRVGARKYSRPAWKIVPPQG